ncbi:MAG: metallophosphoesterase family protein [Capsulimonadales bacterium]|nr:metallophosphoesterase family protein [Capsulimonadales bacterium]
MQWSNLRMVAIAVTLGVSVGLLTRVARSIEGRLPGQKEPDATLWRPLATPDRIILTFKGDPARGMAVTWRTDTTVAPGQAFAQIAPATAYPKFEAKSVRVPATSTPLDSDLGPFHCHSAEFTDLKPATQYVYRVGDGANWSEWIHFKTASDRPEPFSFIYFGDAQNDIKSLWSRAIRSAYSDAPKAAFMIHAGDLVNDSDTDGQWGEWFYAGGWVNGMMPSLPTPGNHEYGGRSSKGTRGRGLSDHWRPQFTLPENGPAGLEETCYYVDYQGVRFISLNSNEKQPDQVPWLEKVLSNNPNRWTVLTFHHPMYSSAKGRDNKELREMWMPIFDKYRVDLVLTGHDHTYARSRNMRAGVNARNGESGTVYVVSVSGPKMYNLEREPWMSRAAEDTQLYQVIRVDGNKVIYEARTVTGELYDAFTLEKQRNGVNKFKEQAPKTQERLRANGNVEN